MLVVVADLLDGRSLGRRGAFLFRGLQAPIRAVLVFQLVESGLLAAFGALAHFELFLDALQSLRILHDRGMGMGACFRDFLDGRQPSLFRWQAGDGVRDLGDHLLGKSGHDRSDRGDVGLGIVCLTRAVAAEEKLRPLRCVAGQRLAAGHRSWQVFRRDRQRLE